MATLNLPKHITERLQAFADQQNQSLADCVTDLLDQVEETDPVGKLHDEQATASISQPLDLDDFDLNEAFINFAIKHVPTIFYVYDLNNNQILYHNDTIQQVLGYEINFFYKMGEDGYTTIYHPQDQPKIQTYLEQLIHSPYDNPIHEIVYRVRHHNGTYHWLQNLNRVLARDENGHPQLIIGVAYDITAQELTQQQLRRTEHELKDLNWSLIQHGASRELLLDQLNKDLREREQRYRQIVETANEGIWVLDHNACTTYVNARMAQMLGYTPDDMLGRPLWDFMTDEATIAAKNNFERRRQGITEQHDFCFQHRDGHAVWTTIATSPMTDERGTFTGTLGMVTDITERKQVEHQLRDYVRFVDGLTRAAPVIISVFDLDTNQGVFANDAIERLLGYTRAELRDSDDMLKLIVHPDDMERMPDYHQRLKTLPDGAIAKQEIRCIRKDGSICWLLMQDTPFKRDDDGRLIQYLSISQDITERKQTEATLYANEQRLRAVTENAPDIIFSVEVDYQRIEYLNRRDFFGYDLGTFNTISEMSEIFYLEDLQIVVDAWVAVLTEQTNTTQEIEYRINNTDGGLEWVRTRLTPYLFDESNRITHVLCHITPITQQKEAEIARIAGVQRERELSAMQSQFVMTASHEFRTPLTTILSSTDLLRTKYDQMRPEWRTRHFDKVESQVDHMTSLLDDVLMVGRLEANTVPFELQAIDVCKLVDDVIQGAIDNGATSPLEFTCQQTGFTAMLDRKLIHKIITNLISNAIKYSPDGKMIYVDVEHQRDVFHLIVRDQGIGIPLEDQAKLFTPFQRARNVDTIQGTGLGLSIAKHAIELHQGSIKFFSQPGEGTTFIVTLPIQPKSS